MKTSERLKKYRKSLGLSQDYVAKQLGVSRTTITAIENDDRNITAEELKRFSEIYGVSVDHIVYGDINKSDLDVNMFARSFSELSENDKKEIMNLIDFKKKLKETSK